MTDCDMVAVYVSNGKLVILDVWSRNTDSPPSDESLGGKQDYIATDWSQANGNLTVVLVRKLDTGDKYDEILARDMPMEICWAYLNDPQWREHSNYGSGKMVWVTDPAAIVYTDTSGKQLKGHQALMGILWLLVINIAIIPARYFKTFSRWYLIHSALGWIVIIISYFSMAVAFKEDKLTSFSQNTLYHSRLGLAMMSILIGQGFLGLIARFFMMYTKNLSVIAMVRRMHRILGYALVALGFAACYYGEWVDDGNENPPVPPIIATVFWVVIYGVLEILWQLGPNRVRLLKRICRKRPVMTHAEVLERVEKEDMPYSFYDQYVLNMNHFTNPHPGGGFMIRETYGEDLGKYFSGTNGFGSVASGYKHSTKAFLYLKWLIIGKLPAQENYFVGTSPGYKWMTWSLDESKEVATNTNIFSFSHDNIKVVDRFAGIDWIGKHFAVRAYIQGQWIVRYYSLSGTLPRLTQGLAPGALTLLVKNYAPLGKMSSHMFKLAKGDHFEMKGPLGPGLALTPASSGKFLAIGAGTGIMPFLDLVEMMIDIKLRNGSSVYPLNLLNAQFSLMLFVSFRSTKDNFAKSLLDRAAQAFKDEADRFTLIAAYDDDKTAERLSADLLQRRIGADKITRAWICGPPGFNKYALDTVLAANIERKVVMVL
jgi:ferredoxin-NADP reductase